MEARELHDYIKENPELWKEGLREIDDRIIILSALSLLAAAERNDGTTPETDALRDAPHESFSFTTRDERLLALSARLELRCQGLTAEVVRLREALKTICEEVTMPIRNAAGDVEDATEAPAWSAGEMVAIARRALDDARAGK